MEATFTVSQIKSVIIAAAKKDARFYLVGALVECRDGIASLVATDGHRLHMYVDASMSSPENANGQAIIPLDALEVITKCSKRDMDQDVFITITDKQYTMKRLDGPSLSGSVVDATFPDYRRILPRSASGVPGQFNPALLADVSKAASFLGCKAPAPFVHHNGDSAAACTLEAHPEFLAVVMPCRVKPREPFCFVAEKQQAEAA